MRVFVGFLVLLLSAAALAQDMHLDACLNVNLSNAALKGRIISVTATPLQCITRIGEHTVPAVAWRIPVGAIKGIFCSGAPLPVFVNPSANCRVSGTLRLTYTLSNQSWSTDLRINLFSTGDTLAALLTPATVPKPTGIDLCATPTRCGQDFIRNYSKAAPLYVVDASNRVKLSHS